MNALRCVGAVSAIVPASHATSRGFVGQDRADPEAPLVGSRPPASDLHLAARDAGRLGFVRAGEILYRAVVAIDEGDGAEARRRRDALRDLVPYGTCEMSAARLARADRER